MTSEEEKLYEDLAKKTGVDLRPIVKMSEQLLANSDSKQQMLGLLLSWVGACFVLDSDLDGTLMADMAKFLSYFMTTIMHYAEEALVKQEPPTSVPPEFKRFLN